MAAQLPLKLPLDRMQSDWASKLNPLLNNPANSSSIINNIKLKVGANVINHLLGQTQQGWIIIDQQGPASIYRSAPFNNLTLTLTSSAAVTISLEVF